MTRILPFIVRAYSLLLHFCPRAFRDEFGDEMLEVFANALADAKQQNRRGVATVLAREFWGALSAIMRERWRQLNHRRGSIMTNPIGSRSVRDTEPSTTTLVWF